MFPWKNMDNHMTIRGQNAYMFDGNDGSSNYLFKRVSGSFELERQ